MMGVRGGEGTHPQPPTSRGTAEAESEPRDGRTAHEEGRKEPQMAQNRTARREATREEFGKAVAKAWEQKHEGSMWAWKSATIGNVARDWARRTEEGWRHEATEMSDAEIFETLGMDEELETEEQTTEIATEDTTEATETTEMATEEEAREWSMLEADIDTETVANMILEWRDGYRCEPEEVPTNIELWAVRHSKGYLTQAQKWEQDPDTADAWQKVWEHVRAGRIGGYTPDWAFTDDAWLLAAEFANEVLGEMDEPTAEWEDLVDKCLAEIGRLL